MRAATVLVAACLSYGGTALTVADAPRGVFAARAPVPGAPRGDRNQHRCSGLPPANSVFGTAVSVPRGAPGIAGADGRAEFRSAAGTAGTHLEPAAAPTLVERTVHLMGTWATLVVEVADRAAGLQQLERMVGVIERTEASLSTWRADSGLSALNRQPVNEPFPLPPGLCGLWPQLARWHRLTGGAFDPAVGRLGEAWGLRAGGSVPAPDVLRAARAATGLAHFRFDAVTCRVTRTANATLDAGAFGKGEALRRLIAATVGGHPWMVDFGGQIAVGGTSAGEGWPVAIAHPARRQQAALALDLTTGSLATSAASGRSWVVEGRPVAHILDPRTGQPIHRPESVTVWHEDPLAADILSTALYVMGADDGLDHAQQHGIAALFLVPDPGRDAARVTVRASRMFEIRFPAVARTSGS